MDIKNILQPISLENFKTNYFKKKGLFIQGNPTKFNTIFNWSDINHLIDSTLLPDKDILLIKNGKYRDYSNKDELRNEINNGATLVINKLHQKNYKVGLLAEEVGYFFQEPTQVNLYLGQPNIGGFNLHYDTHDVFIFQISGNKRWKVYEPTLEFPIFNMKKHEREKPKNKPYLDCTLNAGDFLYLPRGHWHSPIAVDEPSLHLTLGIKSRTGLDFLKWLRDELSDDPKWREELTFNNKQQLELLLTELKDVLNKQSLYSDYNKFCKNNLWIQSNLNFPYTLKNLNFKNLIRKKIIIRKTINVNLITEKNTITLEFKDKKIKLVKKTEKLIKYLVTNKPLNLSELDENYFDLSQEQIIYLCQILLQHGLLSIIDE